MMKNQERERLVIGTTFPATCRHFFSIFVPIEQKGLSQRFLIPPKGVDVDDDLDKSTTSTTTAGKNDGTGWNVTDRDSYFFSGHTMGSSFRLLISRRGNFMDIIERK